MSGLYPLITRDPASGEELIVTRLECPSSGVVLNGRFSLGWIAKLTPEQIDFVGVLLRNRNNLQKLANELGVAYNTARSRLDDVVAAVGGSPSEEAPPSDEERKAILNQLSAGEIDFETAMKRLGESG